VKRFCTLAVAGVLVSALGVRAQTPATTFRAGVEVVDVDVSVLDRNRRPVLDLTAADFTVLEDGKPRPIAAFTPVDLAPRELPSARWLIDVAPDAQTNDLQREGRLVVVLLDRTVAPSDADTALHVAEAAIDQLRPDDLAAVVFTEYGIPQNFTTDRRRLLAAIRQPTAGSSQTSGSTGSCYCGTCTLDRITDLADAVRDVRQRRKLLFVIGSNIAVTSRGGCASAVSEARDRALRAIGAANLTVYAFDPSGLQTLLANASMSSPSGRMGLANLQRISNLMMLPDHTGGRAVFGNEPAQSLPAIFRESNSYYVIGFHPAHADGRFHDIAVKVSRPGVILQARRGYYAAGAKPRGPAAAPRGVNAGLHEAIAGLWPKTGLGLTLTAAPIAMPGLRAAAVALTLGVEPPPAGGGPAAGSIASVTPRERPLNVLIGAFDREGRSLAFEQGTLAALPRRGPGGTFRYELLARLELKPGRYEIRAAVEDTAVGETGSVYGYVDIPNYVSELVSLSGILLYMNPAEPMGQLNDALHEPIAVMPTPRRQFARGDHVAAWLQICQGLQRSVMPGYVYAEILDENEQRVFHQETRTLATDVGANRAMNMSLALPLETLDPGQYVLSVEARQGNASARRDVRFSVR
jgi:VWFA-related protein